MKIYKLLEVYDICVLFSCNLYLTSYTADGLKNQPFYIILHVSKLIVGGQHFITSPAEKGDKAN